VSRKIMILLPNGEGVSSFFWRRESAIFMIN
jgi:hypothetical protein